MTGEEYHRLLRSDYWKGFSYSIIKERNFTCEDCGRRFYNQRNKLQVHHLVYRDINPWSYKPEEMVVLCEDCHKKRHGLYVYKPKDDSFKEKVYAILINGWYIVKQGFKRRRFRRLFFILIILGIVLYCTQIIEKKEKEVKENVEINIEQSNTKDKRIKSSKTKKNRTTKKTVTEDKTEIANYENDDEQITSGDEDFKVVEPNIAVEPEVQVMTKKEARKHAKAVKRAQKEGVSTEGTTEDILERIEQAKAARKTAKKAREINSDISEE